MTISVEMCRAVRVGGGFAPIDQRKPIDQSRPRKALCRRFFLQQLVR